MAVEASFPLNAWYAAAWSDDLEASLTARVICEIPMVLFRTRSGTVSVLEDVCLHRMLPLSLGRLQSDQVVCGYHGMIFDAGGKCVKMPGPSSVAPPPSARVRAFPAVERDRMIWVWPGDVAGADPALIPDLHWADDPDWACAPSYLPMDCDYRLVLDNLMDLTHETYVHASSIGQEQIVEAPFEVEVNGSCVQLRRWMIDGDAPPFLAAQLQRAHGLPSTNVDRWQIIRFEAPSTIVIEVGVAPTGAGAPQGDRSKGIDGRVINCVTPGAQGECHYFFTYARNFAVDDETLTANLKARNIGIFLEDKTILEAQQNAMEIRPDRVLINLEIDKGSMRARRAIQAMLKAEGRGRAAAVAPEDAGGFRTEATTHVPQTHGAD